MNICHIVPSLEAQYGGPSRSVLALARAHARTGHATALLATQPGAAAETRREDGLTIAIARRDWPQRLCPSAGLRSSLRTSEADVIHHHSVWLRTLHYAHLEAKRRHMPLVISPRGMLSAWAWRHHGWKKRLARRLIHPGALAAADGWHATSPEEEAEIRALGFAQPVCVAPNGVAAPEAAETAAAAEHWRAACPAAAKRPVALFYSRFHRKKRLVELIDTWLEHAPRDWLLLLVGIPEDYTTAALEKYVLNVSGSGRVQVFDGAGRPPPYAIASLFVLPSHNENFGLAVAEAMAHGVPVLVTDTTPWRGVNEDGRGWCVPWSGYAEALRAATAEPAATLRARGDRARDWVLREYSWEQSARVLAEFYAKLRTQPA